MILGLCGKAGCGKDTAAAALAPDFTRIAFADPMRNMLRCIGVPDEYMTDRTLKEQSVPHLGISYRRLAQTLGTEWGRSLDENLWIKVASHKIMRCHGHVVVSDVRFDNEAQLIRSMGGKVLLIMRHDVEDVAVHDSEKGISLNLVNGVLCNNGTIEDFGERVKGMTRLWLNL